MRLALVGDYPLDPNEIKNGPQAVFVYLLEGLKQFPDLEMYVITGKRELPNAQTFQRGDIWFHYLPYPNLPAERSFFMLRQMVHAELEKIQPDLVHAQSGHRYGAMALGSGYPAALTPHNVHGAEVEFTPGRFNRARLTMHFGVSRWYFRRNARHVVSISKYIRNSYEADMPHTTFYDIDNPIADPFFDLDPEQEIPNRMLFVGMLRTRKRPDLALEALALAVQEVPDLCLHFAGAAVEQGLFAQMEAFIAKHNLENNLKILGHLREPQVLQAYQDMSIFLLTSDLETSPMVVQQALAAGKPVVATDGGGTKYLIEEGENGFVVPRNRPDLLAERIVKLAKNPEMRRQFGRRGREEALVRFKAEAVGRKMYAMYQNILSKNGSA